MSAERDYYRAFSDGYAIRSSVDADYIVTRNGYQIGGEIDHQLGCGSATYPTIKAARQAIELDRAGEPI